MQKKFLVFLSLSLVILYAFIENTNKKFESDTIVLGQSCALSGPAKSLGENMMKGANAYFKHINEAGGIHNRKISLISYDDSYEPHYAIENTNKLINKDDVFALFGEVGTPTSLAVAPIVKENNIPFIMPFTGAEFLRDASQNNFINLRASYYMETDALVEYLLAKNLTKISILYQNDGYGKAGYKGVLKAMTKRKMKVLSEGRYRRNTLSYFDAFDTIKRTNPEAIIIIGAYKQSASFTRYAKKNGMENTVFCNISFVGSKALIKALDGETQNVIISQVVPLPFNNSHPAVKEYQEIFSKYYPDDSFGFVSLEGFLSAKLTVNALKAAGEELTKRKFYEAFFKLPENTLEGFRISMNKDDNQALDNIYITKYTNGKFEQLKEISYEK